MDGPLGLMVIRVPKAACGVSRQDYAGGFLINTVPWPGACLSFYRPRGLIIDPGATAPEPATMLLLGLGLVGLAGVRRKMLK